ncbi:MAG: phosphonate ABC transporter, permease protein PhnE [Chloroflexota bacterium]
MNEKRINPTRKALRTFLIFIGLFLLYAFAVQATEVDVAKLRNEAREEQVVGVLRFLGDPDITDPDVIDLLLGDETGSVSLTEITQNTLRLILETIFMALMATVIGTLLAIPVSFLAARNLMLEITSPLAAIMLGLIALPLGGVAGSGVMQLVGRLVQLVSTQQWIGLVALLVAVALIWLALRMGPPLVSTQKRGRGETAVALLVVLFAGLLALFALDVAAVLGSDAGLWLAERLGFLAFLGNFLNVIADLIHLLLPAIVGLLTALVAASFGSRYGQEMVLRLEGTPARLLTAALTVGGTAVLIYGVGAALNWLYQFDNPQNWTTIPALVGGGVAGVLALFVAPKRPFAIGGVVYTISRTILNALRSIESLIMAVIFVVWVGLGPFAGVMALTLHTIAALGKLFSEQIEGISEGPIEAINATGANRLQMVVYAVIPQIIPPYIAYTLYRWDINVRMSTIIGFVGGGGVGFLLSQSIRLLRYREASVMMLAIAVVVSLLDYISASVRKRVI